MNKKIILLLLNTLQVINTLNARYSSINGTRHYVTHTPEELKNFWNNNAITSLNDFLEKRNCNCDECPDYIYWDHSACEKTIERLKSQIKDFPALMQSNNSKVTRALIEKGADLEATNEKITPLGRFAARGDLDSMREMLQKGAKIEGTEEAESPLILAIKHGQVNAANLLIQNGANIEGSEKTESPLIIAIKHGQLGIMKKLLENGASIYGKNKAAGGKSAAQIAKHPATIVLLREESQRREFIQKNESFLSKCYWLGDHHCFNRNKKDLA